MRKFDLDVISKLKFLFFQGKKMIFIENYKYGNLIIFRSLENIYMIKFHIQGKKFGKKGIYALTDIDYLMFWDFLNIFLYFIGLIIQRKRQTLLVTKLTWHTPCGA